ncbi:hypothetical protein TCAL_15309 [Tigriopus californicus]|uniref:Uncharacterized protein n=1 Tax=Tigriopus californicus TaxID=6832 RepID=A0A553PME8_TIGCA|nr:uncharacterized protein LOC131889879 [Tigriopus californicus]TRY78861.1 hypothetical protein TCAL_15309 [Tigriopus californicus]
MSSYFLKNLYLNQELKLEEYEQIPYPRTELHIHVMYKATQMFSLLGFAVVGPITCLVKTKGLSQIANYAPKMGTRGLALGLIMGPIMTEATIRNATQDAIYDRSFRLRHNKRQLNADRFSTFGLLGGLAIHRLASFNPITVMAAGYVLGFVASMAIPVKE